MFLFDPACSFGNYLCIAGFQLTLYISSIYTMNTILDIANSPVALSYNLYTVYCVPSHLLLEAFSRLCKYFFSSCF